MFIRKLCSFIHILRSMFFLHRKPVFFVNRQVIASSMPILSLLCPPYCAMAVVASTGRLNSRLLSLTPSLAYSWTACETFRRFTRANRRSEGIARKYLLKNIYLPGIFYFAKVLQRTNEEGKY